MAQLVSNNIFSFLSCFIKSDSILLLTKLLTREDFYSDTSYMELFS